jgi:hypothetical protein
MAVQTEFDYQTEYERMHRFKELSMMLINGQPVSKLDYVAHISIHGSGYFNVFRRYNSRYEFLVEDLNGDIHFHKDVTIRQSLQAILCLTDEQMATAVIVYATGFKMQTPISLAIDTHWSELHREHHGAMITVEGILEDYPHATTPLSASFPSMMDTPIATAASAATAATATAVLAPVKAPGEIELCELCVESVKQNLFEEFAKARQLKRKYDNISMVKEEDSESEEEDQAESDLDQTESDLEEEEENNLENKVYMTLRSRTIQQ